jgi:uncharacterized membrane protein YphA (DoxX/SURF4 family)
MWWYGSRCRWLAFLIIFFLLPLGYGWGYRGWGPWHRQRPTLATIASGEADLGWGPVGLLLWVVVIIAITWPIAAVV